MGFVDRKQAKERLAQVYRDFFTAWVLTRIQATYHRASRRLRSSHATHILDRCMDRQKGGCWWSGSRLLTTRRLERESSLSRAGA